MSASSPPSLPRAFLHSVHPHHPSSPSPPLLHQSGPIYTRLSNGSHSAPSPTNSRSSFHGVSFLLQIGLTRETVNLEASDVSLSAVKDLVCSIVDQKVGVPSNRPFIKVYGLFPAPSSISNEVKCFVLGSCSSDIRGTSVCLPSPTRFICWAFVFQSTHLHHVAPSESDRAAASPLIYTAV